MQQLSLSMDWFKGKSAGNHRFSHYIWAFPVNFPLNQSIIIAVWNLPPMWNWCWLMHGHRISWPIPALSSHAAAWDTRLGNIPGWPEETLRLRSDCRYQIPVWALGCIHHWLHVMGPCQVFRDLGIYSVGTHAMHGYAVLSELGEYLNPHHTLVIELLTALTHPLLGNLWRFRVT